MVHCQWLRLLFEMCPIQMWGGMLGYLIKILMNYPSLVQGNVIVPQLGRDRVLLHSFQLII